MGFVEVGDVRLCYEAGGDPDGPPVLLVAGLGVQLIDWPDHFVEPLVAAGFRVIRLDNRDIGLSTSFDGAPDEPQAVFAAMMAGEEPQIAYTLADMAADAAGLLSALGLDSAHVVGASMGGMISQALAIGFPERVRSLTSIMSTTGAADVGQPSEAALAAMLSPAPGDDRESRVAHGLKNGEVWASPDHFDREWLRASLEAGWDRVGGPQAANQSRQLCAILASPARDELLAMVQAPTLVIHGRVDPLVSPSGGERTAACVAGSDLLMIDDMAHDLPAPLMPTITGAIIDLINRTETE